MTSGDGKGKKSPIFLSFLSFLRTALVLLLPCVFYHSRMRPLCSKSSCISSKERKKKKQKVSSLSPKIHFSLCLSLSLCVCVFLCLSFRFFSFSLRAARPT